MLMRNVDNKMLRVVLGLKDVDNEISNEDGYHHDVRRVGNKTF